MLGCAPAGVAPSGLGHGAAWGKKVVDEGKLKMRARKRPNQRLREMPIKPPVVKFRKAAPP